MSHVIQPEIIRIEVRKEAPPLVLVVDDSLLQRKILRKNLEAWGYQVAEAGSGREALEFCREASPDLVLSDWMMPEMDGISFCKAFKAQEFERFAYFILLTSKSGKNEIAEGLEAGADDFLTKPVSSAELRARLVAGERILSMERELTRKNELVRAAHDELQVLYKSIDNDLIEARQLQQSLVKERFRAFDGASISLVLQPCGHVGGDLVGFFQINADEVGIFAIDVSGHGISSALMTARLAGYLSSSLRENNIAVVQDGEQGYLALPAGKVVEKLNHLVMTEMTTEHYFTMLYAVANTKTGEISFSQAGHPHPLIRKADGRVEEAGTGGLPVGLLKDAKFETCSVTLERGEKLLVCSDGVNECMSPTNELFDDARLVTYLQDNAGASGQDLLNGLMFTLDQFRLSRDFSDDVSAILWEFSGR